MLSIYGYRSAWIKGAVATLLVNKVHECLKTQSLSEIPSGRVSAMTNDLGRRVQVASPSTPVSITGLNGHNGW